MDIIPAALAAIIVGILVGSILNSIPFFSIFSAPMGFVSGIGVGIYVATKSP